MNKKNCRFVFCLPQKMKDWLAKLSEKTGISEAEHLRRAIDLYRDLEKKS